MFETKKDIYDALCRVLDGYMHPEECLDDIDWEIELYQMLVKIKNQWDDII